MEQPALTSITIELEVPIAGVTVNPGSLTDPGPFAAFPPPSTEAAAPPPTTEAINVIELGGVLSRRFPLQRQMKNPGMRWKRAHLSFRVPPVIIGKRRRQTNVLDKKKGKSAKNSKNKKKGKDMETAANEVEDATQNSNALLQVDDATQSSTVIAPYIQGGYTSLLLGVQDATQNSTSRRLDFEQLPDDVRF